MVSSTAVCLIRDIRGVVPSSQCFLMSVSGRDKNENIFFFFYPKLFPYKVQRDALQ